MGSTTNTERRTPSSGVRRSRLQQKPDDTADLSSSLGDGTRRSASHFARPSAGKTASQTLRASHLKELLGSTLHGENQNSNCRAEVEGHPPAAYVQRLFRRSRNRPVGAAVSFRRTSHHGRPDCAKRLRSFRNRVLAHESRCTHDS